MYVGFLNMPFSNSNFNVIQRLNEIIKKDIATNLLPRKMTTFKFASDPSR